MACQEGAPCINDILPMELLVRIASLLDKAPHAKTSLKIFSEVCKQWRSIGRDGVRSLAICCRKIEEKPNFEQMGRRFNLFPCLESLHLVLDDTSMQAVEVHCEKILSFVHKSSVRVKHLEFSFTYEHRLYGLKPRVLKLPKLIFDWDCLESFALRGDLVLGGLSESETAKWTSLKSLTLADCEDLHFESKQWTGLQHLQINNLGLGRLPGVIESWKHLKVLALGSPNDSRNVCPNLRQFPPSVGAWSQREVLRLRGASKLESLPPEVKAWSGLRELYLSSCSSLTKLPSQVSAWGCLQTLKLEFCPLLSGLPVEVKGWKGLRNLSIRRCSSFQDLSEGVRGWTGLQEVWLEECDALETLPKGVDGWSNLRRMSVSACGKLGHFPKKGRHWDALEDILLHRSRGFKSLLPVEDATETTDSVSSDLNSLLPKAVEGHFWGALLNITLRAVEIEFLPECVDQWGMVQNVTISYCSKLCALPSGVRGWKQLQTLCIRSCERLLTLPREVCEWKQLHCFLLTRGRTRSPGRIDLPLEVGAWQNLEDVEIEWVAEVPESARSWSKLTRLCMRNLLAHKLPDTAVAAWTNLRSVIVHGPELLALPDAFGAWEQLEQVQLLCGKLERLPDTVGNWTSVKLAAFGPCVSGAIPAGVFPRTNSGYFLGLSFGVGVADQACRSLTTLPESVSSWSEVLIIVLRHCVNLHHLPGCAEKWPKLQALDLTGCSDLLDLPEKIRKKSNETAGFKLFLDGS